MAKVFIGGSRRLSRLNQAVKRRIDNIIQKDFVVIVGDANGADKAVQRYLHSRHFSNVVVFCMEGCRGCRNNIGTWPIRMIAAADPRRRDFAYYSTKDRTMVEEADYGLMLWDGKSRGTLTNIIDLVRQGKPAVVYTAPDKSFWTLRQVDDVAEMLGRFSPAALHQIERDLQAVSTGGSNRKTRTPILF